MARAIFYSLGGGLGHLNRSLAIIRQLRRASPHLEPIVITNSPYCHLALATGVPVLRLPSSFELGLLAQPELAFLLARAALETLLPFDVLVVDAHPAQLTPSFLDFLDGGRYLKAFLYRREDADVPDERLAAFDLTFFPFPAAQLPAGAPARLTPTGYIVGRQPQDVLSRAQARLRLGLAPDGEEPVVLSYHACSPAETMGLFRQVKGASDALGIGHSLRLSTPQILPGVEYFYPNLVSIYPVIDVLEAADLVVCAAGYSSFAEVTSLGKRAIFRPIERSYDHQHARTGGFPTFEADTTDEALAAAMRQLLTAPPPARGALADYRGAETVAEAIANAMYLQTQGV